MKLNYGDRLRAARTHKKLTQNQLAEKSGVGQGTISKIERGGQECSAADIKLAMALDINPVWLSEGDDRYAPSWLITGTTQGRMEEATGTREAKNHYQSNIAIGPNFKGDVPLISWVKAGDWCEATDLYNIGDAEDWLPCPVSHGPHTYCLRVKGDSMTNTIPGQKSYPEGTIIFVDPDRSVTNGCRVIAKIPGANEATFKEYREDSGKRYLKPLNQQYQMQEIADDVIICGVVIFSGVPE